MADHLLQINDTLPSPQAFPAEVRPFLAHELIAHGMSEEQAVHLAALWTVGTGQDLRGCPPEILRSTFGELAGWILQKGVRARVNREKAMQDGWSSGAKCKSHTTWIARPDK